MKKNRFLIGVFSFCAVLIVCVLATIVVFAGGTHNVQSSFVVSYKAVDVQFSVSATYTINGVTKNMTDDGKSSGKATISFDALSDTITKELKLQDEKITFSGDSALVFAYTFANDGEVAYATLTNGFDASVPLKFSYSTDGETYTTTIFTETELNKYDVNEGKTTLYVKVERVNIDSDGSYTGSLNWEINKNKSTVD